jgi:hypothetical protein
MKSGEAVTADIINSLLSVYNLHTTDKALNALINMPFFMFEDLYKDLYKDPSFIEKFGKAEGRAVAGVYIFTHKETGAKYVGSSAQLATRLRWHLTKKSHATGKFAPFLSAEGLAKFTLKVIPIYDSLVLKPELILEQYYLLDASFNLNLSRVANVPGLNSKEIYMYNKDKTILIYRSSTVTDLATKFGIRSGAIWSSIETGTYYLGNYVFSPVPLLTAKDGGYSDKDVQEMLTKDRENVILYMYDKDQTTLYFSGINKDFSDLLGIYLSNLKRLKNLDYSYLGKYILTKSAKPDVALSNMSTPELLEQLKKDKIEMNISTGKGIGVALFNKSNNKTIMFKSLNACAEYLTSIGLKTTGPTLKSRIVSGMEFNGYLVERVETPAYAHSRANPISVTNIATGAVSIYDSLREAERGTGI